MFRLCKRYIFLFEEGYYDLKTRKYCRYVKDYLGNVRLVHTSTGVSSVTQQNDYYPFGMLFGSNTNPEAQPYKHIGKEFDPMHGLNQYDFHARQHDPAIGRFMSIDPLAEKYYSNMIKVNI